MPRPPAPPPEPSPRLACRDDASCGPERLALDGEHGCLVTDDARLACWGRNDYGQARPGRRTVREPVAALVPELAGVRATFATNGRTCALLATGAVYCWGYNAGLLGDGTLSPEPALDPRELPALAGAETLVMAPGTTCARMPGANWLCWGAISPSGHAATGSHLRSMGVAGDGPMVAAPAPAPAVQGAEQIGLGEYFGCARFGSGTVRCWGYSNAGWSDIAAIEGVTDATQIGVADFHACALRRDRTVACWNTFERTPQPLAGATDVVALSADGMCGLRADRTVVCWRVGTENRLTAAAPVADLPPTRALFSGQGYCAHGMDGRTRCWNVTQRFGELATGEAFATPVPATVRALSDAAEVSIGRSDVCARRGDRTVACWGEAISVRSDRFVRSLRPRATPVRGLNDAVALAARCALRASGALECFAPEAWGASAADADPSTTPVDRRYTASIAITDLASHQGNFSQAWLCGRDAAGRVQCFDPLTTTTAATDAPVAQLVAGHEHVCARRADGSVWCWGKNAYGQYGDGTRNTSDVPLEGRRGIEPSRMEHRAMLPGPAEYLAAGDAATCARLADQRVFCWGAAAVPGRWEGVWTTPQPVPELDGARALAVSESGVCALTAGGAVRCYGVNTVGQNGTNELPGSAATPIASGAVAVARGGDVTCAIMADRTARCWGDASSGQLGDDRSNEQNDAVTVAGF